MMNRTGESGAVPARNKRCFRNGTYWYYSTREGVDIGPFDSLQEAETGVSEFIDFILHAEPAVLAKLSRYSKAA